MVRKRVQILIDDEKLVNEVTADGFDSFFLTEKRSEILLESSENCTLQTQLTPIINSKSSTGHVRVARRY